MVDDQTPPERPRAEPEILPPDRTGRAPPSQQPWQQQWQTAWSAQNHGGQRIYVTRIGPFGFALIMLALALVIAAIFLTIIGAVLIWIPLVILGVAATAVYRLFRR